eukprot:5986709-Amphidinium_carterae.1
MPMSRKKGPQNVFSFKHGVVTRGFAYKQEGPCISLPMSRQVCTIDMTFEVDAEEVKTKT